MLLPRVVFPAALPSIFAGLRIGIGLAWVLVVVAEMIAVKSGLGFVMWDAYYYVRMDIIIAAMLSVGLLGFVVTGFCLVRRLSNEMEPRAVNASTAPRQKELPRIRIRGVSKHFFDIARSQETVALRDIDLEVGPAEFLTIIGQSGCGKSTLLNLIAGFEQVSAGSIEVDGKPITRPGPDRGVVFQEYALFPWLTVYQNVAFGLREQRVPTPERDTRVREQIEVVGLLGFKAATPMSFPEECVSGWQSLASLLLIQRVFLWMSHLLRSTHRRAL